MEIKIEKNNKKIEKEKIKIKTNLDFGEELTTELLINWLKKWSGAYWGNPWSPFREINLSETEVDTFIFAVTDQKSKDELLFYKRKFHYNQLIMLWDTALNNNNREVIKTLLDKHIGAMSNDITIVSLSPNELKKAFHKESLKLIKKQTKEKLTKKK